MTTGQRIKSMRSKRGLTQDDLSSRINLGRANIANYEADRTQPPSDVIAKIADILRTSTDYLLGRTDNPFPFGDEKEFAVSIDLAEESNLERLLYNGTQLTKKQYKLILSVLSVVMDNDD